MRKFLIAAALVLVSFFAVAKNDPSITGIYDLKCIGEDRTVYTVIANTNTTNLTLDGKQFLGSKSYQKGNEVGLAYEKGRELFIIIIDTVNGTSTFKYGNDLKLFNQGICILDESVLI